MMLTSTTRKPLIRKPAWRKPLNIRSLQMMVLSGVVRRADFNPPLVPARKEMAWPGNASESHSQEPASVQGWLSRLLIRRKSAASL